MKQPSLGDDRHSVVRAHWRPLLFSALAHAALVAIVRPCVVETEIGPVAPVMTTETFEFAPGVPSAPIDVILIEDLTPPNSEPSTPRLAPGGVDPAEDRARRWRVSARSAATSENHELTGDPPSHGDGPHPGGGRIDLVPSREALERIAGESVGQSRSQHTEPKWAYDPKIKMVAQGGGRFLVRDPVVTVRVAPDGTVDLKDRPHVGVRLNLPTPQNLTAQAEHLKRDLAAWIADPYRDARVGKSQDLPQRLQAVPGMCDRYGDRHCFTAADQAKEWAAEDEGVTQKVTSVLEGKLDLTGYLAKLHGRDVYASRKLKILDQTRDERFRNGQTYRAEQLDRSAELVQRNLEALWKTTVDPEQRRATLFAMWDECDESEGPMGEAGQAARAMIIGWIRSHLPAGSTDAYTPQEIAGLDERRASRQHFLPY